jgi:dihydrofolate reductase
VRKLIAAMKMSLDAKFEGPEGDAGWVNAWSDDYGLMPQIDACVLGGGMYQGYENYWTSIQKEPSKPVWITGSPPTAAEIEWAGFAKKIPHYVLSGRLESAHWPNTRFLRGLNDIVALKQQDGKDIYLMGGGRVTASLIEAGLVDELRLIVYPIIAGGGNEFFAPGRSHRLQLHRTEPLQGGLVSLIYRIEQNSNQSV